MYEIYFILSKAIENIYFKTKCGILNGGMKTKSSLKDLKNKYNYWNLC